MADDQVIALFNVDGTLHAMDGVCPHAGGPLGEGTLRGATITQFIRDDEHHKYTLRYELGGKTHTVQYTIRPNGDGDFQFSDGDGQVKQETYRRRSRPE